MLLLGVGCTVGTPRSTFTSTSTGPVLQATPTTEDEIKSDEPQPPLKHANNSYPARIIGRGTIRDFKNQVWSVALSQRQISDYYSNDDGDYPKRYEFKLILKRGSVTKQQTVYTSEASQANKEYGTAFSVVTLAGQQFIKLILPYVDTEAFVRVTLWQVVPSGIAQKVLQANIVANPLSLSDCNKAKQRPFVTLQNDQTSGEVLLSWIQGVDESCAINYREVTFHWNTRCFARTSDEPVNTIGNTSEDDAWEKQCVPEVEQE